MKFVLTVDDENLKQVLHILKDVAINIQTLSKRKMIIFEAEQDIADQLSVIDSVKIEKK